MIVESADIEFRSNTRDAERGIDQLDRKMDQLGNRVDSTDRRFQRWGTGLTRTVTAAGSALVGLGVGFNVQVESLEAQFEVLGGSAEMAQGHMEDLINFSSRTPLQLTGLARASQQLQSFGTDADAVVGQLQMLGDVAGGQQDKLDTLVRAFGRVQTKGRASLEELNMFMEAGVPILQELSDQFGVTTEEMFDLISAGEVGFDDLNQALEGLTGEGGRFNGMMERLSQTTQGKFSTAMDNAKIALGELTVSLMPFINNALDGFTNMARGFQDLDEGMQKLILGFTGVAIATGPLLRMFPTVRKSIMGVVNGLKGFAQAAVFANNAKVLGAATRNMGVAMSVAATQTTAFGVSVSNAQRFIAARGPFATGLAGLGTQLGKFAATLGISTGALLGWAAVIAAAAVGLVVLIDHLTTSRKEAMKMAREYEEQAARLDSARARVDELSQAQTSNSDIVRTLIDEYPELREELSAYGDDVQGALAELERLNEAELARARRPFDNRIRQDLQLLEDQIERQEEYNRLREEARLRNPAMSNMTNFELEEAAIAAINNRLDEQYSNLSDLGFEAGLLTKSYEQLMETASTYYGMHNLSAAEAVEYIKTATFVLGEQHDVTQQLIGQYGTIEELTQRVAEIEEQATRNAEERLERDREREALLARMAQLAEQTDQGRLDALVELRTQLRQITDLNEEQLTQKQRALSVVQEEINLLVRRMELEAMSDVDRTRLEIQEDINESLRENEILNQLLAESKGILIGQETGLLNVGAAELEQAQRMVTYIEDRLGITREETREIEFQNDLLDDRRDKLENILDRNMTQLQNLKDELSEIEGFNFEVGTSDFNLQQSAIRELQTQIAEEMSDMIDDVSVDLSPIFEAENMEGFGELFESNQGAIEAYQQAFNNFVERLQNGGEVTARELEGMIENANGIQQIVQQFENLEEAAGESITRIQEIMTNFDISRGLAEKVQDLSDDMIESFLSAREDIADIFGPDFVLWMENTMKMSAEQVVAFNDIVSSSLETLMKNTLADMVEEFERLGEAIGGGQSAAEATAQSIGNMISSFVSNLPQLLLQAGLQMMAVDWRIGLALVAASGLVALGQGIFGGGNAAREAAIQEFDLALGSFNASFDGLNDSLVDIEEDLRDRRLDVLLDLKNAELDILRQMNDERLELLNEELDAVRKQADDRIDTIEEGYGEELYLLRQQLERNLIDQEQYMNTVQDMIRERESEIGAIEGAVGAKETEVETAEEQAAAEEAARQAEIERIQQISDIAGDIEDILSSARNTQSALNSAAADNPIGGIVENTFGASQSTVDANVDEIESLLERARNASDPQQAAALQAQAEALLASIGETANRASDVAQPYVNALNTLNRRLNQLRNYKETLGAFQLQEKNQTNKAIDAHLDAVNTILAGNVSGAYIQRAVNDAARYFNDLDISAAALGANFVTNGPQMLMVGDNPGGRERVQVTPLSSPNINGPSGGDGITINFNGPVYGTDSDELAMRVHRSLQKLNSRNLVV